MSITTYDELKSAVSDFLNRDDLNSVIPTFIALAEARMNREIRHWRMENRATAEVDGQYSALPSDFIEPIRLHLEGATYRTLESSSTLQVQMMRERNEDTNGVPRYYAITQGELELYPSPNDTYSLEMNYYAKIPTLSASTVSNWLLEHHPDAYLYGTLVHSAPYLADDARTQVWAALYQSAIDAINMESRKAKDGGSGRRMKIRSY
jgi:hypothetical protein